MTEFYDSLGTADEQSKENKIVNTALTALPIPYISGLKLNADIEINGLTLNTIEMPNPYYVGDTLTTDVTRRVNNFTEAVVWVVSDIDGWWNLPEPELPDLPRGWGDGSYDAIGRWSNRIMTLSGSFIPQEPGDAPKARNILMNALSPLVKTQGAGYLTAKEDGTLKKGAKVRLSGAPMISSVNARGRHDFSIGLKAVDPVKYEFTDGDPDGYKTQEISSSTSWEATITNDGNTAVPIIVEISGVASVSDPDNPPQITNESGDQTISLVAGVASGHKLEVDTYNREVLDVTYSGGVVSSVANGRSKVTVLTDWIYLNPGANRLYVSNYGDISSSTWTIYYRSGWIA
jgi:hypothetical protein